MIDPLLTDDSTPRIEWAFSELEPTDTTDETETTGKNSGWAIVRHDGELGLQVFHGDWVSFIPLSEIKKAQKEYMTERAKRMVKWAKEKALRERSES